jgi:hypothetical protein
MNPITKHYMRLRFQKRVEALKKAGISVTQKNVYDENIQVGVPVPRFGDKKHTGRPQHNYAKKRTAFAVEFVITGVAAMFQSLFRRRKKNVFADHPK